MTPIPAQLLRTFGDIDQSEIAAWWSTLSDAHRDEVARLCDAQADTCFFGVVADESELPEVERGLCDEDDVRPVDEWAPSHFEYLLNHPKHVLIWDQTERTFHVGCTAHREARACGTLENVSAEFACPFGRADCLMNPLGGRRFRRRHRPASPVCNELGATGRRSNEQTYQGRRDRVV